MNKILSSIVMHAVSALTSQAVMAKVEELVTTASSMQITGEEKRALVKTKLKELQGELGNAVQSMSGNLINLAIEAAVAYVASKTGK